jgi:hypothetical protein
MPWGVGGVRHKREHNGGKKGETFDILWLQFGFPHHQIMPGTIIDNRKPVPHVKTDYS